MTYVTNEISINHTHVKKVGHTSEFHFGIYWWTLKNLKKSEFWKSFTKIAGDIIILHMCTKNHIHEVQFLKDEVRQIFLSFWADFYPLPPPLTTQKTKIMKKWKKKTFGDVIILDLCNKKHDQVIMLTQIWSVTNIIFCHFRPFFALLPHYWPQKLKFGKNVKNTWRYYPFTHVYHKSRSYDVWFLRYKVQRTKFFAILSHFLPFDPLNNPKSQNFEETKKKTGDIMILYLCATNDNHMMYGYWDI